MTNGSVYDVIVLGTGAAGLTAALAADDAGARVGIFERTHLIGGTTALSGGTCWVPNHHHGDALQRPDSREDALAYLDSLSHGFIQPNIAAALIDHGPEAFEWLESLTELSFDVISSFPDYHPEHPGGRPDGGRSLDPGLFAYPLLGEWADKVVRPSKDPYLTLPETSLGGSDGRIERNELDRRRELDLRGCGAALVGGLLHALLERGIEPQLDHRAVRLIAADEAITGVEFEANGTREVVRATSGVILATGGFEWNDAFVMAFLRGPMTSPASYPFNTGDGLAMAMACGAQLGLMREAWWVPTIEIPGDELFDRPRSQIVLRERTLPRSIMVNRRGERFANEAANYNALGGAFHQFDPTEFDYANLPCWLVFDQTYWASYGFAGFRGDHPPEWILRANSLDDLAAEIGVPAEALGDTVARWNRLVDAGRDTDFGRGNSAYDGWNGDAAKRGTPAATLGPISDAPFYAVRVHSGCLGTKGGPMTDPHGTVLDIDGRPIDGLYAAGNVMACPTGLVYGGAGGTLGPAITFGYLAGQHAGQRALQGSQR